MRHRVYVNVELSCNVLERYDIDAAPRGSFKNCQQSINRFMQHDYKSINMRMNLPSVMHQTSSCIIQINVTGFILIRPFFPTYV